MGRRFICFLAFSILAVGAAAAQTEDCAHAVLMKLANKHGFRLQTSDANELYCRNVMITGSRIPRTQCGTEAELASYLFQVDYDVFIWSCKEFRRRHAS
jgi:hypothetical protein